MLPFTEAAQDAPRLQTGEEWAYLIWGLGIGVECLFVHQFSFS
jgi:hypothetical protein